MTVLKALSAVASVTLCMAAAHAQSNIFDNCRAVVTDGLREYSIKTDSRAYLNSVFDKYCESSGSVKSSSLGFGLDLVVKALPLSILGSFSSNEEAVKNFCRNYSSVASARSDTTNYQEKIVQRAYESFDQCIALAQTGVIVRHAVRSLVFLDFYVAPGFSRPVTIKGVKTSPNVECRGQDPNSGKSQDQRFDLSTRIKLQDNRTLNVVCERKGRAGPKGETVFDEAVVTLLTDVGPNGNYAAFVPRDTSLPENRASEIERTLQSLAAENAALKQQVNAEAVTREAKDAVLGRWIFNVYEQARVAGMPPHQGANGWWQQYLINGHADAAKQLPR